MNLKSVSLQTACTLGFLYARHPQVHSFLIGNGCADLLQQHTLGTVLQLEGTALTYGALVSLGGLGLLFIKSFVCKSTNFTACRLVPSIILVVQDCHSPLCKRVYAFEAPLLTSQSRTNCQLQLSYHSHDKVG